MAKRFRCPRPVNRLVMLRTRGLSGPLYQNTGKACVASIGSAHGAGGPLSGPKPASGIVTDATSIQITFTQCVNITGVTGIEYQINGGAWTQVTAVAKVSDTVWDFTVGTITAGDEVNWRYVGGSGTIVDCVDASDIGDQQIPVTNNLVLAGNYILTEEGGASILLVEEDTDGSAGVHTEEAV